MEQEEVNGGKISMEAEVATCNENDHEEFDPVEERRKSSEKFKDLHDLDKIYDEGCKLRDRIEHLEKYLTGRNVLGERYLVVDDIPDCLEFIYRKKLDAMKEYFNCIAAEHAYWERIELLKPDGVVKE